MEKHTNLCKRAQHWLHSEKSLSIEFRSIQAVSWKLYLRSKMETKSQAMADVRDIRQRNKQKENARAWQPMLRVKKMLPI